METSGLNFLRVDVDEPHVWTFLILVDFLSCLRASLDHAIWRLAALNAPDGVPADGIQFPIIETNNASGRRLFTKQTTGLPPEIVDVIERLQPFNRPGGFPRSSNLLWRLGKLANIDESHQVFIFQGPSDSVVEPYPGVMVEIIFGSESDGISLTLTELADIL